MNSWEWWRESMGRRQMLCQIRKLTQIRPCGSLVLQRGVCFIIVFFIVRWLFKLAIRV